MSSKSAIQLIILIIIFIIIGGVYFKYFSKDVKPGPLEISEKIELLRFIEQGVPVKILHFENIIILKY